MTSRIIGTGSFVPTKTVSNFDLSELVDTNNDWIVERTGIVNRRIAQTDSTVSLAVKAALAAIENASIKPEEIDLIIVATFTPDNAMPNTACEVQKAIGAYHAFCFDLNAACSGSIKYPCHKHHSSHRHRGNPHCICIITCQEIGGQRHINLARAIPKAVTKLLSHLKPVLPFFLYHNFSPMLTQNPHSSLFPQISCRPPSRRAPCALPEFLPEILLRPSMP